MYTIKEAEEAGLEEITEIDMETCSEDYRDRAFGFFKGREIQPEDFVIYANAKTGVIKRFKMFNGKPIETDWYGCEPITLNGSVRLFLRSVEV